MFTEYTLGSIATSHGVLVLIIVIMVLIVTIFCLKVRRGWLYQESCIDALVKRNQEKALACKAEDPKSCGEFPKAFSQIYVDLDGVLADFAPAAHRLTGFPAESFRNRGLTPDEKKVLWSKVSNTPGFWENLGLMPRAKELWKLVEVYDAKVLTAVSKSNKDVCAQEKCRWAYHKLFLCRHQVLCVEDKTQKILYAVTNGIPNILIDDHPDTIEAWRKAGGLGVLYSNPDQAIEDVQRLIDGAYYIRKGHLVNLGADSSSPEPKSTT
jgi:5'(3')-deoxyribonucleotidase